MTWQSCAMVGLALCAGAIGTAQAQQPPVQIEVTPKGLSDTTYATSGSFTFQILLLNANGPVSASLLIECKGAITNCNMTGLGQSGGVQLNPSGAYQQQVTYTATGFQGGSGSITLRATTANPPLVDSATLAVRYIPATHGVTVTVSPKTLDAMPSQPYTTTFTVKNTGNVPNTFVFSAGCRGPAVATCGNPSLSGATLGAGKDTVVTLAWTAASVGAATSWISMTADDGNTASGMDTETLTEYAVGLDVVDANPGVSFNRANCLTIAVAPHAAWECGDLRITHPLPSVRTYNKVRTPTLVYNWRFATPAPNIGALLTIAPSSTSLDSVNGKLYIWPHNQPSASQVAMSGTWPGADWKNATVQMTRRVQLSWGGYTSPGGEYDYAFVTQRHYGTTMAQDSAVGHFVFVNWWNSPFGAGWWLAGYERLWVYSDGLAWQGGDGSTQLYVRPGNTGTVWYPQTYVAERDSIMQDSAGYYYRHAAHGTKVQFFSNGLHWKTFDRLGHVMGIAYDAHSRIMRLDMTAPTATSYYFTNTGDAGVNDTAVTQIMAPGNRLVTFRDTLRVAGATRSHLRITDPDGDSVLFAYDPEGGGQTRILSRTDKRGTVANYSFGLGAENLGYTTISMAGTASSDVHYNFGSTNNFGQAAPWVTNPHSANQDSINVYIIGARGNGSVADTAKDTTRIWIDQWWEPTRLRDAHGNETLIHRLNSTYPTRPTRVMDPLGRIQTVVYDARGNDSVVTDFGLYLGDFSRVTYRYDPRWDFVQLIDPPKHDSLNFTYDSINGNRWTQHDARGDSTTVTYQYNNVDSLLSAIIQPDGGTYAITYDATLANVATTQTAMGVLSTYTTDALGRTIKVVTAADTGANLTVRTVYDVMDRVDSTITAGDATRRGPLDSAYVANAYDPEGNLTNTNRRTSSGDPTNIGVMMNGWVYDRANRVTVEQELDGLHDLAHSPADTIYYDPAGNKILVVNRRSDRIPSTYDALNQLTVRIYPAHTDTARKGAIDSSFVKLAANTAGASNYLGAGMDTANTPAFTSPYPLHPNDSQNPNAYTVFADTQRFGYDQVGRLLRADNIHALIRRSYLLSGLLASDTEKVRPLTPITNAWDTTAHVYGQAYTYDLGKRLVNAMLPAQLVAVNGTVTHHGYDLAGQLDTVIDALSNVFTYAYNARGDRIRWQLVGSQGPIETYKYDLDSRPVFDSVYQPGVNPPTLRQTTYLYDVAGKLRVTQNNVFPYDTLTASNTGLGYLTDGSLDSHTSAGSDNELYADAGVYQYDGFGNRYQTDDVWGLTLAGGGNCGFFLNMCYFATLGSGHTTEYFFYQSGTGRLVKDSIAQKPRVEFMQYDADGNDIFESGWPGGTVEDTTKVTSTVTRDKASYYGSDGKLHAVDRRNFTPLDQRIFDAAFEEYRYDALGRRVLVYTQRVCGGNPQGGNTSFGDPTLLCGNTWVRRTIWDGADELGEIQMPADANAERDTGSPTGVPAPVQPAGWAGFIDLNKYYGSVLYTHSAGIDRPQSIVRNDYTTRTYSTKLADGTTAELDSTYVYTLAPFAIIPLWDVRGQASAGTWHTDTIPCGVDTNTHLRCPGIAWSGRWFGYERASLQQPAWNGTLVEDKADASGNFYRRNRYYDANTGRFTQGDPMGLAGGINTYGFANGDPINYGDPLGLKSCSELREALTKAYKGFMKEFKKAREFVAKGRFNKGHWEDLGNAQREVRNRIDEYKQGDSNGNKCDDDNDPDHRNFAPLLQNAENWSQAPLPMWQRLRQDIATPADATAVSPNAGAHAVEALTAGIAAYWIISEASRLIPVRNLVPVP